MKRLSSGRIREIVRKEFLQIRRDARLWRVIFVAPVLQLVVFGYAVSTDLRNTKTFLVDLDGTLESRRLADAFTGSGRFRIVGRSNRPADLVSALDRGDVTLGLEIPTGFAEHLQDGTGARVQLLFDGSNSNMAIVARGYAERIIQGFAASLPAAPLDLPIDLREFAWYNPDLSSRSYNVPAVVGTIMMLVSLLLTSLAVVREREIGTLEQLLVSPLSPRELIIGKTLPFALIGLFDMIVITGVALWWFEIPFRGSFLLLLVSSVLYLLPALGMGLFISTISRTQQEAFLTTFLVIMPTILLSGFMFPVSSMPPLFQWLTLANPMRHFLEIVRGIFLKGIGLELLWKQLLALLVMGIVVLNLAVYRFRRVAAG